VVEGGKAGGAGEVGLEYEGVGAQGTSEPRRLGSQEDEVFNAGPNGHW